MNEMTLMRGKPIKITGGVEVKQFKLGDIEELGIEEYYSYLHMLLMSKKELPFENTDNVDIFELFYYACKLLDEFRDKFLNALRLFTGKEVGMYEDDEKIFFHIGNIEDFIYLSNYNFDEFRKTLRECNKIRAEDAKVFDREFKPANERARKFIERAEKKRKMDLENNENALNLLDMIDIVTCRFVGFDVWECTVWNFYRIFDRLLFNDKYERDFAQAIRGAEIKDMKHWATKKIH